MSQEQTILKRLDMYLGSSEIQPIQQVKNYCKQPTNKQLQFQKSTQQIFNEIIQNAYDNYIRSGKPKDYVIEVIMNDRKFSITNNGGVFDIQNEKDIQRLSDVFYKPNTSSHYLTSDQENTAGMNGLGAKLCNYLSKYFAITNSSNGQTVKIVFTPKHNLIEKDIKIVQQTNNQNQSSNSNQNQTSSNQSSSKQTTSKYTPLCQTSANFFQVQYELPDDQTIQILKTKNDEVIKKVHFENFNQYMIQIYLQELIHLCPKITFNGKPIRRVPFEELYQLKNFYYTTLKSNNSSSNSSSSKKSKSKKASANDTNNISNINDTSINTSKSQQYDLTFIFNDSVSLCVINGITSKQGSFLTSIKRSVLQQVQKTLNNANNVKIPNLNVIVYGQCQGIKYNDQIKNTADLNINFTFNEQTIQFVSSLLPKTLAKKPMNNVAKLIEATMSGNHYRSLILTEGDSAKTVFERLNGIFHKHNPKPLFYTNGLYPLKGKILNIRRSKASSEEIDTVLQISGLQKQLHYKQEDIASLRYQRIIIATDFDEDGYHIKNLVISFLLTYWPELLDLGYVQEFISPILRYTTVDDPKHYKYCYNIHELSPSNIKDAPKIKTIKYYKGLGTLENEDLEMISKNFAQHIKTIDSTIPTNHPLQKEKFKDKHELIEQYLTNLFSQDTTKRKSLIMGYKYNPIDYNKPNVSVIQEFNQFLEYGYTTQNRAIPSEIDGFKDSQRKIIYYVLKYLSNNQEMKVAQLSGYVSAKLDYHHGETSLDGAIVQLAQSFAGSNNIPLLIGKGSFGTRSNPNAIAASRYIYVQKSPLLKLIFREEDEIIYNYNFSEDQSSQIEPVNLYPIIPIHLINGVKGIGTGFSSTIPSYNPLEIINYIIEILTTLQNLKQRMNVQNQDQSTDKDVNKEDVNVCKDVNTVVNKDINKVLNKIKQRKEFIPFYKGYIGTIQQVQDDNGKVIPSQFICEGQIQEQPQQYVLVKDVCINTYTSKLIETLKEKSVLGDIQYLGDTSIKFSLVQQKNQQIWEDIKHKFLQCTLSTKNMVVLKDNQTPTTYTSSVKLLYDWTLKRLTIYKQRKDKQLIILTKSFLEQYYIDEFVQKEIYKKLQDSDFYTYIINFPTKTQIDNFELNIMKTFENKQLDFNTIIKLFEDSIKQDTEKQEDKELDASNKDYDNEYGYLINKTIKFYNKWKGYEALKKEFTTLFNTSPSQIFLNELNTLKQSLSV